MRCNRAEALREQSVDLVISGLALHYVADFSSVASHIATALRSGGSFVFSVEHPLLTCDKRQWHTAEDGSRLHWPVDRYLLEGQRRVSWLNRNDIPRYHHHDQHLHQRSAGSRLDLEARSRAWTKFD